MPNSLSLFDRFKLPQKRRGRSGSLFHPFHIVPCRPPILNRQGFIRNSFSGPAGNLSDFVLFFCTFLSPCDIIIFIETFIGIVSELCQNQCSETPIHQSQENIYETV